MQRVFDRSSLWSLCSFSAKRKFWVLRSVRKLARSATRHKNTFRHQSEATIITELQRLTLVWSFSDRAVRTPAGPPWTFEYPYLASELFEHPQGQPFGIFELQRFALVWSLSERAAQTPVGAPVDLRTLLPGERANCSNTRCSDTTNTNVLINRDHSHAQLFADNHGQVKLGPFEREDVRRDS